MKNAQKNGYGYITPSMARLYSYLGDTPIAMSELARRLKISRQAVHQLVTEGLNSEFLEVIDSPEDKRIKLVKFSEKGKKMSDVALAEIHQAEQDLAKYLGEDNVKALRRILEMEWPEDLISDH
ncbi:MarR family winged helix-turn-helix transcriptional regulator [Acinetobacter schindleri]|uniref:MarR family winged helix-turn-helix transcriptional regulator n=1 Tax=Acinetobacter schindleri TaxID=108981 RepID=UPI002DBCD6FA|nr:MarR family transcriptional regulator [Acinetobacter schindleri]MEB5928585.1 MarR family transcriptional regulator [Acinetobacter schindleri]